VPEKLDSGTRSIGRAYGQAAKDQERNHSQPDELNQMKDRMVQAAEHQTATGVAAKRRWDASMARDWRKGGHEWRHNLNC